MSAAKNPFLQSCVAAHIVRHGSCHSERSRRIRLSRVILSGAKNPYLQIPMQRPKTMRHGHSSNGQNLRHSKQRLRPARGHPSDRSGNAIARFRILLCKRFFAVYHRNPYKGSSTFSCRQVFCLLRPALCYDVYIIHILHALNPPPVHHEPPRSTQPKSIISERNISVL